jgi:RNA polymerase sigma factor (sigma-70 family)
VSTLDGHQLAITQDKFDILLGWLDPDRDIAGGKYEEIRHSLIKIFTWRGCAEAEDMADDVINRVLDKLPKLLQTYEGKPAHYFYGVAKKVAFEYSGKKKRHLELTELNSPTVAPAQYKDDDSEKIHECLEHCMQRLTPHNREMITAYYSKDKQEKIDSRRELAKEMGVELETLRVQAYRIRATLEKCIKRCLKENKII